MQCTFGKSVARRSVAHDFKATTPSPVGRAFRAVGIARGKPRPRHGSEIQGLGEFSEGRRAVARKKYFYEVTRARPLRGVPFFILAQNAVHMAHLSAGLGFCLAV